MKTIKTLSLLVFISLLVFSCKKDSKDDPSSYPFSKESVDENKTKIADAGQELITQMTDMQDVNATEVLESFASCSETDNPMTDEVATKSAPAFRAIEASAKVASGSEKMKYLVEVMKSSSDNELDSIQEIFEALKGTYTWNASEGIWDYQASNEVKFLFPSTKAGTTNNAVLTLTYTGKTGVYPIDGYTGDVPAKFNATIKVDNTKVFEVELSASYNSDGMPTSVNYFVALYPYKFEITWKYSTSSVSIRYHFTNDTKTILDFYGNLNGNFSKANIQEEATGYQDIVYNGNSYFQIFNIKIVGDMDYKGLYNKALEYEESGLESYQVDSAMIKELNTYANLDVVLADSKEKIATVEFYPIIDEFQNVTLGTKFVYGDGTSGDIEAYFGEGFDDFISDLNTFITDLNDKYDLNIEPVSNNQAK